MKCTTNGCPKQCMMRVSEFLSGEVTFIRPKVIANDLELVMECTMSDYTKQCMMRVSEVHSGEMMCVKPNALAKDLERIGMHNKRLSQAMHDEGLRVSFR
jgi:hypothetical protein